VRIAGEAVVTVEGGMLTAAAGDAFSLTGGPASITLRGGAWINAATGVLCRATGAAQATIHLEGETIAGDVLVADQSAASLALTGGTALTGAIRGASLTLDGTSRWVLTADSTLRGFSDPAGISGSTITNVVGQGFVVTYDPSLAENAALGGLVYTLVGGGTLTPR
jgi:hypothetical protein